MVEDGQLLCVEKELYCLDWAVKERANESSMSYFQMGSLEMHSMILTCGLSACI